MKPLPFDCERCVPIEVVGKCHECQRWADHPEQTFSPRTPYTTKDPKTCGVPELEKTK